MIACPDKKAGQQGLATVKRPGGGTTGKRWAQLCVFVCVFVYSALACRVGES